jgi:hypothetical protein
MSNTTLAHKQGEMGTISDYAPSTAPMVPSLIVHCVNEVDRRGLNEVGIYRIPGSEKDVRELKVKDTVTNVDKSYFTKILVLWSVIPYSVGGTYHILENILPSPSEFEVCRVRNWLSCTNRQQKWWRLRGKGWGLFKWSPMWAHKTYNTLLVLFLKRITVMYV